ncbi:hypothetical protein BaRGS_00012112 [Batillaria attramentaria]|uniref:Uncharacterized protein n=1 Tax=Batillaria attramentaria TaxID=370345 RepID=A0ABD0LBS5_9CAEN
MTHWSSPLAALFPKQATHAKQQGIAELLDRRDPQLIPVNDSCRLIRQWSFVWLSPSKHSTSCALVGKVKLRTGVEKNQKDVGVFSFCEFNEHMINMKERF